MLPLLDMLKHPEPWVSRISMLERVGQKVLDVVWKYKRNQLAFLDWSCVFDPSPCYSMPHDINHYTLLFPNTIARWEVQHPGEWALY